jgi:hypothetical protein
MMLAVCFVWTRVFFPTFCFVPLFFVDVYLTCFIWEMTFDDARSLFCMDSHPFFLSS